MSRERTWHVVRSEISQAQVLGALSYALDLTEGQPAGHCLRGCWIGMAIGRELGMSGEELYDLYYTLLLKDAGCSSNAARLCELYAADDLVAKHDVKTVDIQKVSQLARFVLRHAGLKQGLLKRFRVLFHLMRNGDRLADELIQARCTRGAEIALELGFSERVAAAIHALDEHWNGKGRPDRLAGTTIPLGARIALLAQVIDVFHTAGGRSAALAEARARAGTWFDPELVAAFERVASRGELWAGLAATDLQERVQAFEPPGGALELTDERLDAIARGFGRVIDAKSPFTAGHSARVARYSERLGVLLGFPKERLAWLRRSAYLHDIGKLGVSNTILDKPGKLDEHEWAQMHMHPTFTEEILSRIDPFRDVARMAAAHHERLDGRGYPKGLEAPEIDLDTRIVTCADIFDALTADRPYRAAMPLEQALEIMRGMCGTIVDPSCFAALERALAEEQGDLGRLAA